MYMYRDVSGANPNSSRCDWEVYRDQTERSGGAPRCFNVSLDDLHWNHAVAVILLASAFCFICFIALFSRHVAVATGFPSKYRSHAA